MSTQYVNGTHPILGDIAVKCVIESWGYPSNGWDDPGSGTEWYVDAVWSESENIRWFMPKNDYDSVYEAVDTEVQMLDPGHDDSGWIDY